MFANPMIRRLVWLAVKELATNPALRRDLADGYRRARPRVAQAYRRTRPQVANAFASLAAIAGRRLRRRRPRGLVETLRFRIFGVR